MNNGELSRVVGYVDAVSPERAARRLLVDGRTRSSRGVVEDGLWILDPRERVEHARRRKSDVHVGTIELAELVDEVHGRREHGVRVHDDGAEVVDLAASVGVLCGNDVALMAWGA